MIIEVSLQHTRYINSIFIFFTGCDAIQTFREVPRYTEVNPGGNAELRCVIDSIGGECRWQKDGKVITSYLISKTR